MLPSHLPHEKVKSHCANYFSTLQIPDWNPTFSKRPRSSSATPGWSPHFLTSCLSLHCRVRNAFRIALVSSCFMCIYLCCPTQRLETWLMLPRQDQGQCQSCGKKPIDSPFVPKLCWFTDAGPSIPPSTPFVVLSKSLPFLWTSVSSSLK